MVTSTVNDVINAVRVGFGTGVVGTYFNNNNNNDGFSNTNIEQDEKALPIVALIAIIIIVLLIFVGVLVATYRLVPSLKVLHVVLVLLTGLFWVLILWLWYGWIKSGRIQV
tara:strand:+ start:315 stop:647 length:333 start_codon:yes stop_codon:yes gene_type:complete